MYKIFLTLDIVQNRKSENICDLFAMAVIENVCRTAVVLVKSATLGANHYIF